MNDNQAEMTNDNLPIETRQNQDLQKRVYQWKYTACRYNIENSNGFYTFSHSEKLTKAEKEELCDAVAHYTQLDSAPLRPTSDDLRDPTKFPIAFTSFKLTNGKAVLSRVRAVGQDYGGTRYGNFFAHALVLSDGAWREPLRYWDSAIFADGLSPEEKKLGRTPEPLPTLGLDDVKPGRSDAFSSDWNALRALADGFVEALRRRKNLVVLASPQTLANAARILGDFLETLPVEIASKIEFTTYSHNPIYETLFKRTKYVFIAFAPLESDDEIPRDRAVVVNLETALQTKNVKASWAKLLSPKYLKFAKNFKYSTAEEASPSVADWGALEKIDAPNRDERLEDLRYLNGLTVVYAMCQGRFPQIEHGWEDVWESLNVERKTVLRERWLETWRFLNEQPFELRTKVAETLLGLDLKRLTEPTFKLQENVADEVLKDFKVRDDSFKRRYDIAIARNLMSFTACLYVNYFSQDKLKQTLREAVFNRWTNFISDSSEESKLWRRELPKEIAEIFDVDGPAAVATNSQKLLSPEYFLESEFEQNTANNIKRAWLTIALGIAVAIERPASERLGVAVQGRLRDLFKRYFGSSPKPLNEFEMVYKDLWIENIRDASSYALIFDILGVRKDSGLLEKYVDRLISEDSLNAWKRGETLKRSSVSRNGVAQDNEIGADEEEEKTRELVWNTTEEHTLSNASANPFPKQARDSEKKEVDAEPGAYAFAAFLAAEQQNKALKKAFEKFSRREFKRAQKFFNNPAPGRNNVDISAGERDYKWYEISSWTAKRWLAVGASVLLLGVAIGVCVYFLC